MKIIKKNIFLHYKTDPSLPIVDLSPYTAKYFMKNRNETDKHSNPTTYRKRCDKRINRE